MDIKDWMKSFVNFKEEIDYIYSIIILIMYNNSYTLASGGFAHAHNKPIPHAG